MPLHPVGPRLNSTTAVPPRGTHPNPQWAHPTGLLPLRIIYFWEYFSFDKFDNSSSSHCYSPSPLPLFSSLSLFVSLPSFFFLFFFLVIETSNPNPPPNRKSPTTPLLSRNLSDPPRRIPIARRRRRRSTGEVEVVFALRSPRGFVLVSFCARARVI